MSTTSKVNIYFRNVFLAWLIQENNTKQNFLLHFILWSEIVCFYFSFYFHYHINFFRLTDPAPTTETSIAPRQRPKAGQPTPAPSALTIQPAVTPRKRSTALLVSQPATSPLVSQPATAQLVPEPAGVYLYR